MPLNTLSQWLWPGFRGSLTSGPDSGSQELPVEVLQGLLSPKAGPRLEAPLPSWRAPLRLRRGLPEAAGCPQHRAASSPDNVPGESGESGESEAAVFVTCPRGHTLALLLVGSDSPPPLKGRGLDSTFWGEHQRICGHFLQHPTALLEDPSDAHLLVPQPAQLTEHPTPWLHRPMSCGSAGPVLVTASQPHALSLLL